MECEFKVGQTVKLRNGTVATVTDVYDNISIDFPVEILTTEERVSVTKEGRYSICSATPYDVMSIITDPNEQTTIIKSDKTVDELIDQFVEINGFTPNMNEVLKRFVTFANQDDETKARYKQFLELKKEFGE